MPYTIEAYVIEIKADFDPFGNEYVQVSFGYRLPVPAPLPQQNPVQLPVPQPVQLVYKHALHIYLPKDQWRAQYTMWQRYLITILDDGSIEVKKATM